MNAAENGIAHLVAICEGELLVVPQGQGKWGLPRADIRTDVDLMRAEEVLRRHSPTITVTGIEAVPESEIKETGNAFFGSRLFLCSITRPREADQAIAWLMKGPEYPKYLLTEEVQRILVLPSIQKRLA